MTWDWSRTEEAGRVRGWEGDGVLNKASEAGIIRGFESLGGLESQPEKAIYSTFPPTWSPRCDVPSSVQSREQSWSWAIGRLAQAAGSHRKPMGKTVPRGLWGFRMKLWVHFSPCAHPASVVPDSTSSGDLVGGAALAVPP